MAVSFMKTVRRCCRLQMGHHDQFSAVSFLVMVLLATQTSSAKILPLGDVEKIPELAPLEFPLLHRQNMVDGYLHRISTLPQDAERLRTFFSGQPVPPNKRLLYQESGGYQAPHLYVRAPSLSGKQEDFQFSLKEYKEITKPYHKLVILDGHDKMVNQLLNTFWDPDKVAKVRNLADDEHDGNSELNYQDQEMVESTPVAQHVQSKAKRSLRLPRSPVTSRGFLGAFSGLYPFGEDEGQGERPFRIPTGYDSSEASTNPHVTNNHQKYLQEGQWNAHTITYPEALYPIQHSNSFQTHDRRSKILSHGAIGDRESFRSGGYAQATLGNQYDTKNTFQENLRNYVSHIKVSQKKTMPNKKRDLSREHVTLGENLDTGRSQKATLNRFSAPEDSNINTRAILETAVMKMITRGEEHWDERERNFDQHFELLLQDELLRLTSQHNIPVPVSEQVLTVSPAVDKSSEYDHMIGSVPPDGDVYSSAVEGALVLETGDQQKFWLEDDSGLLHDNVFSRAGDQTGIGPTVEPHLGLRIFKRSAGSEGLTKSVVHHLVKQMKERSDNHTSGTLSKRSPLSHGYVAGIDADADHHQNQDHITAATTGSALHPAHHHETLPPAVILSSEHHHNGDAQHLVAKSETTVGGTAGGAGSGRGPNHEDPGPGALVVLHPTHPLVAAHADDDTIHVIAAVPFAVAHHHELHHEADHLLSKSTTLTLAQHDTDPHVLSRTTTVTTVTQHDIAPLLVVHPDAPVVLLHHPLTSQSSTSTTTVHKPPGSHNLLRVPLGGFGVGVTFGGAGAGHGFYAAG